MDLGEDLTKTLNRVVKLLKFFSAGHRPHATRDEHSAPRLQADDQAVYVEVSGSVDFSLLHLLSPGDAFEITVRAVARPEASP